MVRRYSLATLASIATLVACANDVSAPLAPSARPTLDISPASNSTLLIDTGPGGSNPIGALSLFSSGSTTCSPQPQCAISFQFLAGQFTLAREARLESVQGWMSGGGGSIAVVIRAENDGIPGSSIFSKTYTQGIQSGFDWVVFSGYDVVLAAGTYWLSFEPVANSGFQGSMSGGAPAPLPNSAFFTTPNYRWINLGVFGPQPGLGMRISEAALTPAERIANLRTTLSDLDLPTGIATSFDAKLRAALTALDAGDTALGCSSLQSLINALRALSGKKIAAADAATLIAEVTAVRTELGC